MPRRNASEKLKLLDEYIQILLKHFYLRPSPGGPSSELSSSELFACNVLGRRRRRTMTELAKECDLALSSMTAVVDQLIRKGCVERFRDEEDRRKVFVELDRKGEKIYQELLESEMEMIISMMNCLKPDEQDALLRTLGKAIASLGN